jgi:hypothetical protein
VLTAVGVRWLDMSPRPSSAAASRYGAEPAKRPFLVRPEAGDDERPSPPGGPGGRTGTLAALRDDQTQPRSLQALATRLTEIT